LNWLVLIPTTIILISIFDGKANDLTRKVTLTNYEFGFNKAFNTLMDKAYIPVICLMIASGISLIMYLLNRKSYKDSGMTTWWFPNPGGKPAVPTVIFQMSSAIFGSAVLVYVVHHLALSVDISRLLGGWSTEFLQSAGKIQILDEIREMKHYFESFIYPLAPAVMLCVVNIVVRRVNLKVKWVDPVVLLTIIASAVILILLYYAAVLATGLASEIEHAEMVFELKKEIPLFPHHFKFWGWVLTPPGGLTFTAVLTKIVRQST